MGKRDKFLDQIEVFLMSGDQGRVRSLRRQSDQNIVDQTTAFDGLKTMSFSNERKRLAANDPIPSIGRQHSIHILKGTH